LAEVAAMQLYAFIRRSSPHGYGDSNQKNRLHGQLDDPVVSGIQPVVPADVIGDLAEVRYEASARN
jgi:hypothetical protein